MKGQLADSHVSVDFEQFYRVVGSVAAANWQTNVRMMYLALDRTGKPPSPPPIVIIQWRDGGDGKNVAVNVTRGGSNPPLARGFLKAKDIEAAAREVAPHMDAGRLAATVIAHLDCDTDGRLTYRDFERACRLTQPSASPVDGL
jgi:hypothetical protein